MSSLSHVLRERRRALGLTLAQIAKRMEVSEATVQRWESGNIQSIRHGKIDKLATLLQVSPARLMGWDNVEEPPKNKISEPTWRILDAVPQDENMITVPIVKSADVIFHCLDDSMKNARIYNGDFVFIHLQSEVNNGEIAVIRIRQSYSLRRVYKKKNGVELRAENPLFPPVLLQGKELEQFCIVGRAVQLLSSVI